MREDEESVGGMRRVWNGLGGGSRVTMAAHGGHCAGKRPHQLAEAEDERDHSSLVVSSPGSSGSMPSRHSSASAAAWPAAPQSAAAAARARWASWASANSSLW